MFVCVCVLMFVCVCFNVSQGMWISHIVYVTSCKMVHGGGVAVVLVSVCA